ncbi:uncharacterized protein LOC124296675 [Neodiprion virginianus]|uniref:uncharacterized protein LOC124296675 n=1 Tax=Neodiprion virginianus TaxID=2961670 RepID=UPI001EE70A7B|nr:uncharacterized protein LOC124296675 [Neodiprion virginianus]XP_046602856.1 uncharacterized protein LOC124296675 [Neodiprion virginianus]XP_046602857.1 uncharacterized protein LOC124296675 [Neodiprion virginianus]
MCDKRTLNRDKINKTRRRQRQIVKAMARDIDMRLTSDETSTDESDDRTREPRECSDHCGTSAEEHPDPSIIVEQEEQNSTDYTTEEQENENSTRESSTEQEYEERRSRTSESTDDEEERNVYQELREWAVEFNIPHRNLEKLLDIIRRRFLPELPKSAKTFWKTNSCTYIIRETESGQFVYFGLESGLRACIIEHLHPGNQIFLQVNVDGLSVFESSSTQFWPILCKVHSPQMDLYTPFIVGCYCGNSKPLSRAPHIYTEYHHKPCQ